MKITQPILIQNLEDEFDTEEVPKCEFSAEPGRILVSNEANYFTKERLKHYQSFIVKLLHLMKHIRVESQNAI